MSSSVLAALLAWLLALAIFLGFIVLLRYIDHRERMAMIRQGFHPSHIGPTRKSVRVLRAGLIILMVGLALTAGLYPIGFLIPPAYTLPFHAGPWLLLGLIPLAVGVALIVSYYLAPDLPPPPDPSTGEPQPHDS
jgi:hypothetical protein